MYDVLCAVVWVALCAALSSCVWALMCLSVCSCESWCVMLYGVMFAMCLCLCVFVFYI